ncbi:MAG: DNA/RNA non-specific endonuclease, partial [Prevotella sp.]|nr:DNA/RNA non-specific endonuclease [Prevotella sp.]
HTSRYYGDPQYPMDPDLPTSYYLDNDYYWGSGFDHGHICPSADRLYSAEANYQTFFLTNMQPQYKNFNGSGNSGGVWLTMENKVRQWTPKNTSDTLYIVKGGTIDRVYLEGGAEDGVLQRIDGKLIVPKYFFVALLYKNSTGYRGLALWFPHNNEVHGYDALTDYALSIDELEARTGIDFFCNLPDDIEGQVERALPLSAWGL